MKVISVMAISATASSHQTLKEMASDVNNLQGETSNHHMFHMMIHRARLKTKLD